MEIRRQHHTDCGGSRAVVRDTAFREIVDFTRAPGTVRRPDATGVPGRQRRW
ncbi:hypothetical protein BV133_790 [Blastochloris viridis]|uniref:Uncharacterized protein n=1 Tax=Blastochloris viridis TaxID=1079 RepID=A0A182CZK2_BLAVI|nr:hypothetical protein BV133_790 [Blastochloris viridis]